MQVISHVNKGKWNSLVHSFANWDVYYLCEYAISFMNHGDGIPLLFYFEDGNSRLCYPVMLNDIADFQAFRGSLTVGKYFDLTTPYGYGGPLVEGNFDKASQERFLQELSEYCNDQLIITQFIRFHPLFQNQMLMEQICELRYMKDTVTIDTSTTETINNNMDSKNRNMIRKAQKLGVSIIQDDGERVNEFLHIYESTMYHNKADKYYSFTPQYFEILTNEMNTHTTFFYSCIEGKIIGSAIFFYNDRFMHYHLSGTLKEYRQLASTNLLLYEASLWASRQGIQQLHLGGGLDASDSLFQFKKQFNKHGRLPFFIGRNIFNKTVYSQLLEIRKSLDPSFNAENSYFIQYRKE